MTGHIHAEHMNGYIIDQAVFVRQASCDLEPRFSFFLVRPLTLGIFALQQRSIRVKQWPDYHAQSFVSGN